MTILVTGANGFVGQALCKALRLKGQAIRGTVRAPAHDKRREVPQQTQTAVVGSISAVTDWTAALEGVKVVVHLAARAHALDETAEDALATYYRQTNMEATERLAGMATAAGVKRFVFLSSVKINGERTPDRPFTEDDAPRPEDAYGISKWEAEQALWRIAKETGLEVVVLRPPLVYGPGVKGNFLRLVRLVERGVPLPLASVHNRRSLIYVDNLVGAIITCMEAPAAAGNPYLVSDGEDVSTPELIRGLAAALGVPVRLFPFPAALLKLGAAVLGKSGEIARLTGSLQVDSSRIRRELGWQPRFTLQQGLEETARWYSKAVNGES